MIYLQAAIQASFVVFILLFAWFQGIAVKAMRDYVPVVNPYSDKYHFRGNAVAVFIGFLHSLVFLILSDFSLKTAAMVVVLAAWYVLVFDQWINRFSGKSSNYVGLTARFDRWMQKRFPHGDGAETVDWICVGVILLLNIVIHGEYLK